MASPAAKGPASYNALMGSAAGAESRSGKAPIKITDQGISGYGEAESAKP
jgi:hypothetical protein